MAFVTIDPTRTDADSIVDQSLMDDIRGDLNDLNTRLNAIGSATLEGIHDNFTANSLDIQQGTPGLTDYPYTYDTGGTIVLSANPAHQIDMTAGRIAASKYRMRFDLSNDHTLYAEFRHISGQSDNTEVWFFGFQDEALATSGATSVTDQTDCIGFVQDATANKYDAICAQGGSSVVVANSVGDASAWTILRIEVTFAGATKKVEFFVNGSSVGSTTDTSKIPIIRMRPLLGNNGGGGSRHQYIDYWDCDWSVRPLSA